MVASAPQSQSQSQTKPLSAEEELLKKNTDCVYFLASPLTCKKGNECEYRHSDNARVNPRDCYFWLNGNCLNPKCAFRHPPLEGLLGTQVPTSTGPSASVSRTVMADTPHVTNAVPTKPGVPTCVFFQKGYCMKGDWCPFLHAPNSLINKPAPMPVTGPPLAEPAANKKALIGLEKTVQEKKDCPVNAAIKSVKDSVAAKPTIEVELVSNTNEFIHNRRAPQTAPVSNGNLVNWPVHVHHYHHLDETEPENINNKDTEEFSRELSPGFDVLVDDDVRDTDYYPGEDGYGILREHEVRNDYNIGLSTDNDERYQSSIGYDSQRPRNGHYGWEQQRGLSERSSGGPYSERRPYAMPDAVGQDDGLDLRHRLQKQKKSNGLRSVISNENTRDMRVGDRISYREENRNSSRENFLISRLRGRISLPGKSQSPDNNRDNMVRGRLSPARVNTSTYQGRARERIRGRVEEGFSNDDNNYSGGKSYRDPHSRRDEGVAGFSGPKSLAELKKKKNEEPGRRYVSDQQQSLGKRKHQESGNAISFQGPKPLEEILKRKRSEKILNSSGNEGLLEDKIIEEGKDHEFNNETVTRIEKNDEVYTDDDNHNNSSKQEGEDGVLDDQDGEEAYEQQRDGGESYYEQVGGEDDDLYDGENREYVDEDDDDFAKKMGVVYS